MQKIKLYIQALFSLLLVNLGSSCAVSANNYKDLDYLIEKLPSGYVSDESELISMDEHTSHDSKYRVMVIVQTFGNDAQSQLRRVAIFKPTGEYVGVFSGLGDIPTSVTSKGIHFPYPEEFGNTIFFEDAGPVFPAYVDGEHYLFVKSKQLTKEQAMAQMAKLDE